MEDAIIILTKMFIKEHCKEKEEVLVMKKEDLIRFCIKLLKIVKQN